jgi:tRNA (guanosine-2'-O-)-methyltransferase
MSSLAIEQLTLQRRRRIESVARHRTYHVLLVLDGVRDPHNISACLRSAEALGIQKIFMVTHGEVFKPSTVSRGASKWLSLEMFLDVETCAQALKKLGYRIATALPQQTSLSLSQIDVQTPLALVFGNEHRGVDPRWSEYLDFSFTIPMFGFVESYNISVSAAISLFAVTAKGRDQINHFYLSLQEQTELIQRWLSLD